MDHKKSAHGKQACGTASALFGGFNLFPLALCCDVVDVIIVGFLSEPNGVSAFFRISPQNDQNDGKPTSAKCGRHGDHSLPGML